MKRLLLFALLLCGSAFGQAVPKVMNTAVINATSNGDNTIIAADVSHRLRVWQFFIVNSHASNDENLTWKAGSTAVSGAYLLKANGGAHTAMANGLVYFDVPAGSALVLNESQAGTITGMVWYTLE